MWEPLRGEPTAAAVVAHPHPLHGGSMKNNVVHRAGRGLQAAGMAVLRFNFRGVSRSEGTHDGTGAEVGDYLAAIGYLAETYPGTPLVAGGFSFGARTAMEAVLEPGQGNLIEQVLLIAPPVLAYPCEALARIPGPGLLLSAGRDEFGSASDVVERFPDITERLEVDEIPDVDHFFSGALPELSDRVRSWGVRALQRV